MALWDTIKTTFSQHTFFYITLDITNDLFTKKQEQQRLGVADKERKTTHSKVPIKNHLLYPTRNSSLITEDLNGQLKKFTGILTMLYQNNTYIYLGLNILYFIASFGEVSDQRYTNLPKYVARYNIYSLLFSRSTYSPPHTNHIKGKTKTITEHCRLGGKNTFFFVIHT